MLLATLEWTVFLSHRSLNLYSHHPPPPCLSHVWAAALILRWSGSKSPRGIWWWYNVVSPHLDSRFSSQDCDIRKLTWTVTPEHVKEFPSRLSLNMSKHSSQHSRFMFSTCAHTTHYSMWVLVNKYCVSCSSEPLSCIVLIKPLKNTHSSLFYLPQTLSCCYKYSLN